MLKWTRSNLYQH